MLRYEAAKRIEVEHDAELEERERLQQERMERVGKATNALEGPAGAGNKSGEWKHSASGLEWVIMEEDQEEQIEREIAAESGDSDMDVEVMGNSQQDEEENFTKGRVCEGCVWWWECVGCGCV